MSNTTRAERMKHCAVNVAMAAGLAAALSPSAFAATAANQQQATMTGVQGLSARQESIPVITAATAIGDMPRLNDALDRGLDAGLTVSDAKEILVQMYAYTGFPRSLNALAELMKVLEARRQRGLQDAPGRDPAPVPAGKELLVLGAANQTKLAGAPVRGPLFDFAPAIDEYLKAHLFGAIFARDNLDWHSRELATVGALSALPGVESQLESHVRISLNVGLTAPQLRQVADALRRDGQPDAARRAQAALDKQPAPSPAR